MSLSFHWKKHLSDYEQSPFRRSSPRESKKISEKKGPAWNSAGERGAFLPEFPGTHKPPLFFVDLTLASRDGLRR